MDRMGDETGTRQKRCFEYGKKSEKGMEGEENKRHVRVRETGNLAWEEHRMSADGDCLKQQ